MNYHVMTLFPEMIEHAMNTSITGRAMKKGLLALEAVNIRDYSKDKHNKVDDYPYGGGAGMVMQPGPVYDCHQDIVAGILTKWESQGKLPLDKAECETETKTGVEIGTGAEQKAGTKQPVIRTIYLTPQGTTFHQAMAEELALEEELIFLCGHYEGIDERVLTRIVTDYVSIGDYVLTGGELPAMVMMDAISRLVPGVLSNEESAETESFTSGLLEYPQYTRPEQFMGESVPEVLLSGHHAKIEAWRLMKSMQRTREGNPKLYEEYMLAHPPRLKKGKKRKKR